LLLIIAIALINNTIRLAIYSKRFLIRTMHWWAPRNGSSRNPSSDRVCGKGSWLRAGHRPAGWLLQLTQHYMPDLLAFTDMPTLAILFGGVLVLGL
jgi:cell division transport system permease protein